MYKTSQQKQYTKFQHNTTQPFILNFEIFESLKISQMILIKLSFCSGISCIKD